MNLQFTINDEGGRGGRTAILGIRAAETEIHDFVLDLIQEAVEEGERVAKALAPRSNEERNRGRHIADAIRIEGREYRAGGQGGGGTQQVSLVADGEIAPQLVYVYEGTADEGTGHIYPARGNVLRLEKNGEGPRFRPRVRGQKPQRDWWEAAQDAMDSYIKQRVRESGIGEAVRK